ncbi:MAG: ATP-binding protein [Desulfurobacteriaceae bacterium]
MSVAPKLVNRFVSADVVYEFYESEGKSWVKIKPLPLRTSQAVRALREMGFPEKYLLPIDQKKIRQTVSINGKEEKIESFEIVRKWAKEKFPKSLLLLGPVGTGKTQAIVVAACHLLRMRKIGSAKFYSAMELRVAFDRGELQKDIREVDLLVIDDLGREYRSDYNAYIVETVITTRYDLQKPVCITANITLEEIAKRYTPRVSDRLREWAYRKVIKQNFSLRGIV